MTLEKLKQKQMKLKRGGKEIMKTGMKQERGITLIALVVTIVVLLILAGVSINALFGNSGIIEKAKEAQSKMDKATENDKEEIGKLTNWLDNQVNGTTGDDDNQTTLPKISTLVGTVVDKNTKAEDAYGNKITIPKGFKVLEHNPTSNTGAVTYNYTNSGETGEHIPAVQDGIVIENGTDGNQFVWVPVGTIKNKDNTTNTITLGRYSNFTKQNGDYVPAQTAENYAQEVTINNDFKELSTFREGNSSTNSTAQNATARNLKVFKETTLANGGYYIARFEASGTNSKITSKYNQKVLGGTTQPNAAKLAREMYGEVKENNELLYASDLINSYAWDTAIIFIQTYSTGEDASSYADKNKGPSDGQCNTGMSNDKYCNIWDMSGNYFEWTTEYSTGTIESTYDYYTRRGGYYYTENDIIQSYTSNRFKYSASNCYSEPGFRSLLYVK